MRETDRQTDRQTDREREREHSEGEYDSVRAGFAFPCRCGRRWDQPTALTRHSAGLDLDPHLKNGARELPAAAREDLGLYEGHTPQHSGIVCSANCVALRQGADGLLTEGSEGLEFLGEFQVIASDREEEATAVSEDDFFSSRRHKYS